MGPGKDKIRELENRMAGLGIDHEDLEVRFVKSSGRGGQKVNKTSSAVFIKHLPTGLAVKCGKTRSQHLNRFLALRLLVDRIEGLRRGVLPAGLDNRTKQRKQKQKRRKRAAAKYREAGSGEGNASDIRKKQSPYPAR